MSAAHQHLSKREREIMDVLYRLGRATAGEILAALPGTRSDSTIRTQLRVLEQKGHVTHAAEDLRYVYSPTVPRRAARRSALRHVIDTFFDGSSAKAMAALLGSEGARLSPEELDEIEALVRRARENTP